MGEILHNKLVRDKILHIINESGSVAKSRILSDDEFQTELKRKLLEEVNEFFESDNMEELADILEVIDALALSYNSSMEQVMAIKKMKNEKRGGFSQRLFLQSVYEESCTLNSESRFLGIDVHLKRLTVACIDEKLNIISIDDIRVMS